MGLDSRHYQSLTKAPSVGAILYQAIALYEELQTFSRKEYPEATLKIRDVLLCILDAVRRDLTKIFDTRAPYSDARDPGFFRTRELARILQAIYLTIRFLRASSSQHCPSGIQVAISTLVKKHVKTINTEPVCLVRAQSTYNAQYYDPIDILLKSSADLWFPEGDLSGIKPSKADLLDRLWTDWKSSTTPRAPRPIAIISFAGLDDHDYLLYPVLLIHEVAHFITFSQREQLEKKFPVAQLINNNPELAGKRITKSELDRLAKLILICLRELIADVLAIRMMGLSFFLANAEFLKTLRSPRTGTLLVGDTGYPENHFRLAVAFNELLDGGDGWKIKEFLEQSRSAHPHECESLLNLLNEWQRELLHLNRLKTLPSVLKPKTGDSPTFDDAIAAEVLSDLLPKLIAYARDIIPGKSYAKLESSFFERIKALRERKAPLIPGDSASSFPEILSSAWAYQMIYGEIKESALGDPDEMYKEYGKTCELVRDAMALF